MKALPYYFESAGTRHWIDAAVILLNIKTAQMLLRWGIHGNILTS